LAFYHRDLCAKLSRKQKNLTLEIFKFVMKRRILFFIIFLILLSFALQANAKYSAIQANAKDSALQANEVESVIKKENKDSSINLNESLEQILKPNSLKKLREENEVIVNANWGESSPDDFQFLTAMSVPVPIKFAYQAITQYENYVNLSPAIKKISYDKKNQMIELEGEAAGYSVHSWIKVENISESAINYEIVLGSLKGFKVRTRLYKKNKQTELLMTGILPKAKQMIPKAVVLIMKPVSEMVLSSAAKNTRDFIIKEYKQKRVNN
jgi:hypothetical protein